MGFLEYHNARLRVEANELKQVDVNSPEFKAWFGSSVIKKTNGEPLRCYHGTKSSNEITKFDLSYVGKGVDQYGIGFYFSDSPKMASAYASSYENGHVYPVYLSIKKPITNKSLPLTVTQILKLMKASPDYEDSLENFGDWRRYGESKIAREAALQFSYYDDAGQQIWTLQRDFWQGYPAEFLSAVTKITGYDGVVFDDPNNGNNVIVAFSPNQIKSALSTKGNYTGDELTESLLTESTPNTHIEHLEDLIINDGRSGIQKVKKVIDGALLRLQGYKSPVQFQMKVDGSPAIYFDCDPERPWVATKSLFNKTPKVNYTPEDININHPAAGLQKKLNAALLNLPKLQCSTVVQGDILFTQDDIKPMMVGNVKYLTVKPNTITYGAKAGSPESQELLGAEIGVALHTSYDGETYSGLHPVYGRPINYKTNADVYVISPYQFSVKKIEPETIKSIHELFDKIVSMSGNDYGLLDYLTKRENQNKFKKFTNDLIRTQKLMSPPEEWYVGYSFVDPDIDQLPKESFLKVVALYQGIMRIKHTLLKYFVNTSHLECFIDTEGGLKKIDSEGYIAFLDNEPIKLIQRNLFSYKNFTQEKEWDK